MEELQEKIKELENKLLIKENNNEITKMALIDLCSIIENAKDKVKDYRSKILDVINDMETDINNTLDYLKSEINDTKKNWL